MGEIMTDTKILTKDSHVWTKIKARKFNADWASEVEVGEFLKAFVRMIKPEACLEIGTFEGDAAIAIAQGIKENYQDSEHNSCYLTTVDNKDYGQKENIKDAGLEKWVHCITNIGDDLIGTLRKRLYKSDNFSEDMVSAFDMIFIDDGHSYNEVMRDLENAHQLCMNGGYILGHDVLAIPDVKNALNEFCLKYGNQYERLILYSYAGLFILHRKF